MDIQREDDPPRLAGLDPNYRLIRQIGRGGQGTVYLAESTTPSRQVALKVMDPGFADDASAVERFRREADITSKLDHPGICTVYETGAAGAQLWIAMKYVEGETLAKSVAAAKGLLPSGRTSFWGQEEQPPTPQAVPSPEKAAASAPREWEEVKRVLLLFEQAAHALHAAHEAGVIHRDVKPGNMMVTRDGKPVILDFGIAVDTGSSLPTLTMTGDLMGTREYMSPEQLTSRITLDRRTDVYSLGASLFECLTLRRPFEAPTREGLYQAIMLKAPPEARRLNAAIPRDLGVVIATALEKDRDRRYQTALAFAEDLRRVRSHEPILAKPVGPLIRLGRWAQRNPALATAVGSLFAVLVTGLTVALMLLGQRDRALGQVTSERNEKEAARASLATSVADYDRLGDLSRLHALKTEADALWPCEPSKVAAMKTWVNQGRELEGRLAGHREALERLRTPAFASDAEQFKHDTTASLVAEIEAFVDPDPIRGLLADVSRRLAFAEAVEEASIRKHAEAWKHAIHAIATSPAYRGLQIEPQMGLIPIGPDPKSGLVEFAHLQTAKPGADPVPRRGPDGRLVVTEDLGLVFVLLPGGTFNMGAVKPTEDQDPADPNVDPESNPNEAPVTTITLAPFFMSKHEMTQGQWLRITGRNPSQFGPGAGFGGKARTLMNPVESVSWDACDLWLRRLGLALPTEAQWEYGARAGTTTPRWMGRGTDGFATSGNVSDRFCKDNGGPVNWTYEAWDDGHTTHAPVGSYDANPFGLHDVLGNVWEWCRDLYGNYSDEPRPGDGLRTTEGARLRVMRGGSFLTASAHARSAFRDGVAPGNGLNDLGARPVRAIAPASR